MQWDRKLKFYFEMWYDSSGDDFSYHFGDLTTRLFHSAVNLVTNNSDQGYYGQLTDFLLEKVTIFG